MKRLVASGILILALIIASGCTSARLNQFQQFAEAGKAYSGAIGILTEEAGKAAVKADSLVLLKTRTPGDAEKLLAVINGHNEIMSNRIALFAKISRHASLLKTYFAALSALAGSEAPSGIGKAAENVVKSTQKLGKQLSEIKVGAMGVSDFMGAAVPIAIAHFQRAALDEELSARAEIIEEELEIQKAAVKVLTDILRTDLIIIQNYSETYEIVKPFLSSTKKLPASWAMKRYEFLTSSVSVGAAGSAVNAAKNLKTAFSALLQNQLNLTQIQALLGDIEAILTLVEGIKGTANPAAAPQN